MSVTTVGVRLSGVTDNNLEEAILFIQANLIMLREDIIRALRIPDFIFYSANFKNYPLTGYTFTVYAVGFTSDNYINISGGIISIPIAQDSDKTIYQKLKADEYYPTDLITNTDVKKMLDLFVRQAQLKVITPTMGDFNLDFNIDFYV